MLCLQQSSSKVALINCAEVRRLLTYITYMNCLSGFSHFLSQTYCKYLLQEKKVYGQAAGKDIKIEARRTTNQGE